MPEQQNNSSLNRSLSRRNSFLFGSNETLPQAPKWLDGSGKYSDIVISSRVRLARNLEEFSFPRRAADKALYHVLDAIKNCYQQIEGLQDSVFIDLKELDELDRQFLMERRLISPDFIKVKRPAGVIVARDELVSIMINEEDHLRIQSIQSGLEIDKAWQLIHRIDDALASLLDVSYSDQFGYLTACPTNTGTGMRVSVFINLSALAVSKKVDKIIKDLAPSEIAIRGFYGEGSDILGDIFQVSNQLTLGRTEQSIINRINSMTNQLVKIEQNAREELLNINSVMVEDKILRAKGTLKYAKILNSVEGVNFLSLLRLGVALKLINPVDVQKFNELLVLIQPAHLQKLHKKSLTSLDRDILRIKLIRKRLNF
jgi:protein arginine kinase